MAIDSEGSSALSCESVEGLRIGVSAYQQSQNWRASQANITSGLLGSAGTSLNTSFAFGTAANNNASGAASLAAQEALTRIQDQIAAKNAKTQTTGNTAAAAVDSKPGAAKTAGAAILASLGIALPF